jgi:Protein tyrosine and serine/threonine kinase
MWERLKHDNVVPFLGVYLTEDSLFRMVWEWMPQGNIRKYVLENAEKNRLRLVSFIIHVHVFIDNAVSRCR